MIQADATYEGTVRSVAYTESSKGTVGLLVEIDLTNGANTSTVLWLTENTTERVTKTLAEFSISAKDHAFWNDPNEALAGQSCSIVTELKDKKVQIKWFNGPKRAPRVAGTDAATRAMGLFGVDVPF